MSVINFTQREQPHPCCRHVISWISGKCAWLEDKEEEGAIPSTASPEKYLEVLMVEMEVMGVTSFLKVNLAESVLFCVAVLLLYTPPQQRQPYADGKKW